MLAVAFLANQLAWAYPTDTLSTSGISGLGRSETSDEVADKMERLLEEKADSETSPADEKDTQALMLGEHSPDYINQRCRHYIRDGRAIGWNMANAKEVLGILEGAALTHAKCAKLLSLFAGLPPSAVNRLYGVLSNKTMREDLARCFRVQYEAVSAVLNNEEERNRYKAMFKPVAHHVFENSLPDLKTAVFTILLSDTGSFARRRIMGFGSSETGQIITHPNGINCLARDGVGLVILHENMDKYRREHKRDIIQARFDEHVYIPWIAAVYPDRLSPGNKNYRTPAAITAQNAGAEFKSGRQFGWRKIPPGREAEVFTELLWMLAEEMAKDADELLPSEIWKEEIEVATDEGVVKRTLRQLPDFAARRFPDTKGDKLSQLQAVDKVGEITGISLWKSNNWKAVADILGIDAEGRDDILSHAIDRSREMADDRYNFRFMDATRFFTEEEERNLAREIESGNRAACETLVWAYFNFIDAWSKAPQTCMYQPKGGKRAKRLDSDYLSSQGMRTLRTCAVLFNTHQGPFVRYLWTSLSGTRTSAVETAVARRVAESVKGHIKTETTLEAELEEAVIKQAVASADPETLRQIARVAFDAIRTKQYREAYLFARETRKKGHDDSVRYANRIVQAEGVSYADEHILCEHLFGGEDLLTPKQLKHIGEVEGVPIVRQAGEYGKIDMATETRKRMSKQGAHQRYERAKDTLVSFFVLHGAPVPDKPTLSHMDVIALLARYGREGIPRILEGLSGEAATAPPLREHDPEARKARLVEATSDFVAKGTYPTKKMIAARADVPFRSLKNYIKDPAVVEALKKVTPEACIIRAIEKLTRRGDAPTIDRICAITRIGRRTVQESLWNPEIGLKFAVPRSQFEKVDFFKRVPQGKRHSINEVLRQYKSRFGKHRRPVVKEIIACAALGEIDEEETITAIGRHLWVYSESTARAIVARLRDADVLPPTQPDAEPGIGPTDSESGIMPHRGIRAGGTIHDQMILTLEKCIPALIEEERITADDAAPFMEWVTGWKEARRTGGGETDVPIDRHLPIDKLEDKQRKEYSASGYDADGKPMPRRLRVVKLPVDKLGEVDGEPFYAHVSYREGIIWVAAQGADEIEVDIRIIHERFEHLYGVAIAFALFLHSGLAKNAEEAISKMVMLRDNPSSIAQIFPAETVKKMFLGGVPAHFLVLHARACEYTMHECREDLEKGKRRDGTPIDPEVAKKRFLRAGKRYRTAMKLLHPEAILALKLQESKFAEFGIGVTASDADDLGWLELRDFAEASYMHRLKTGNTVHSDGLAKNLPGTSGGQRQPLFSAIRDFPGEVFCIPDAMLPEGLRFRYYDDAHDLFISQTTFGELGIQELVSLLEEIAAAVGQGDFAAIRSLEQPVAVLASADTGETTDETGTAEEGAEEAGSDEPEEPASKDTTDEDAIVEEAAAEPAETTTTEKTPIVKEVTVTTAVGVSADAARPTAETPTDIAASPVLVTLLRSMLHPSAEGVRNLKGWSQRMVELTEYFTVTKKRQHPPHTELEKEAFDTVWRSMEQTDKLWSRIQQVIRWVETNQPLKDRKMSQKTFSLKCFAFTSTLWRVIEGMALDKDQPIPDEVPFMGDDLTIEEFFEGMRLNYRHDCRNVKYRNLATFISIGYRTEADSDRGDPRSPIFLKAFLVARCAGPQPLLRSFPELAMQFASGNVLKVEYIEPTPGNPPGLVIHCREPVRDMAGNNMGKAIAVFCLKEYWGDVPDEGAKDDMERIESDLECVERGEEGEGRVRALTFDEETPPAQKTKAMAELFNRALNNKLVARCGYDLLSFEGGRRHANFYGRTDGEREAIYYMTRADINKAFFDITQLPVNKRPRPANEATRRSLARRFDDLVGKELAAAATSHVQVTSGEGRREIRVILSPIAYERLEKLLEVIGASQKISMVDLLRFLTVWFAENPQLVARAEGHGKDLRKIDIIKGYKNWSKQEKRKQQETLRDARKRIASLEKVDVTSAEAVRNALDWSGELLTVLPAKAAAEIEALRAKLLQDHENHLKQQRETVILVEALIATLLAVDVGDSAAAQKALDDTKSVPDILPEDVAEKLRGARTAFETRYREHQEREDEALRAVEAQISALDDVDCSNAPAIRKLLDETGKVPVDLTPAVATRFQDARRGMAERFATRTLDDANQAYEAFSEDPEASEPDDFASRLTTASLLAAEYDTLKPVQPEIATARSRIDLMNTHRSVISPIQIVGPTQLAEVRGRFRQGEGAMEKIEALGDDLTEADEGVIVHFGDAIVALKDEVVAQVQDKTKNTYEGVASGETNWMALTDVLTLHAGTVEILNEAHILSPDEGVLLRGDEGVLRRVIEAEARDHAEIIDSPERKKRIFIRRGHRARFRHTLSGRFIDFAYDGELEERGEGVLVAMVHFACPAGFVTVAGGDIASSERHHGGWRNNDRLIKRLGSHVAQITDKPHLSRPIWADVGIRTVSGESEIDNTVWIFGHDIANSLMADESYTLEDFPNLVADLQIALERAPGDGSEIRLRVNDYQNLFEGPEEFRPDAPPGHEVTATGQPLTPGQDAALREAQRQLFAEGIMQEPDRWLRPGNETYSWLDPNDELANLNVIERAPPGADIYIIPDDVLFERLVQIAPAEAAGIMEILISHAGTFRDEETRESQAQNVFILQSRANQLLGFTGRLRAQWARHEAEHIRHIELAEAEVQNRAPIVRLLTEFAKTTPTPTVQPAQTAEQAGDEDEERNKARILKLAHEWRTQGKAATESRIASELRIREGAVHSIIKNHPDEVGTAVNEISTKVCIARAISSGFAGAHESPDKKRLAEGLGVTGTTVNNYINPHRHPVMARKIEALKTEIPQPDCYRRLNAPVMRFIDSIDPDPAICNFLAGLWLGAEQDGLDEVEAGDGIVLRLTELDEEIPPDEAQARAAYYTDIILRTRRMAEVPQQLPADQELDRAAALIQTASESAGPERRQEALRELIEAGAILNTLANAGIGTRSDRERTARLSEELQGAMEERAPLRQARIRRARALGRQRRQDAEEVAHTERFIRQLREGADAGERMIAARMLRRFTPRQASTEALANALLDPDWDVRRAAALALRRQDTSRANFYLRLAEDDIRGAAGIESAEALAFEVIDEAVVEESLVDGAEDVLAYLGERGRARTARPPLAEKFKGRSAAVVAGIMAEVQQDIRSMLEFPARDEVNVVTALGHYLAGVPEGQRRQRVEPLLRVGIEKHLTGTGFTRVEGDPDTWRFTEEGTGKAGDEPESSTPPPTDDEPHQTWPGGAGAAFAKKPDEPPSTEGETAEPAALGDRGGRTRTESSSDLRIIYSLLEGEDGQVDSGLQDLINRGENAETILEYIAGQPELSRPGNIAVVWYELREEGLRTHQNNPLRGAFRRPQAVCEADIADLKAVLATAKTGGELYTLSELCRLTGIPRRQIKYDLDVSPQITEAERTRVHIRVKRKRDVASHRKSIVEVIEALVAADPNTPRITGETIVSVLAERDIALTVEEANRDIRDLGLRKRYPNIWAMDRLSEKGRRFSRSDILEAGPSEAIVIVEKIAGANLLTPEERAVLVLDIQTEHTKDGQEVLSEEVKVGRLFGEIQYEDATERALSELQSTRESLWRKLSARLQRPRLEEVGDIALATLTPCEREVVRWCLEPRIGWTNLTIARKLHSMPPEDGGSQHINALLGSVQQKLSHLSPCRRTALFGSNRISLTLSAAASRAKDEALPRHERIRDAVLIDGADTYAEVRDCTGLPLAKAQDLLGDDTSLGYLKLFMAMSYRPGRTRAQLSQERNDVMAFVSDRGPVTRAEITRHLYGHTGRKEYSRVRRSVTRLIDEGRLQEDDNKRISLKTEDDPQSATPPSTDDGPHQTWPGGAGAAFAKKPDEPPSPEGPSRDAHSVHFEMEDEAELDSLSEVALQQVANPNNPELDRLTERCAQVSLFAPAWGYDQAKDVPRIAMIDRNWEAVCTDDPARQEIIRRAINYFLYQCARNGERRGFRSSATPEQIEREELTSLCTVRVDGDNLRIIYRDLYGGSSVENVVASIRGMPPDYDDHRHGFGDMWDEAIIKAQSQGVNCRLRFESQGQAVALAPTGGEEIAQVNVPDSQITTGFKAVLTLPIDKRIAGIRKSVQAVPPTLREQWANTLIPGIAAEVANLPKDQRLGVPIDLEIGNFGEYSREFREALEARARELGFDLIWGRGSLELAENIERYLDGDENRVARGAVRAESAIKGNYEKRFSKYGKRIKLTAVDDAKIPNKNKEELYYVPIMSIVEYAVTGRRDNLPECIEIKEEKEGIISSLMELDLPHAAPISVEEEFEELYRQDAVFVRNA